MVDPRCRFCKAVVPAGAERCGVCGSDQGSGSHQRWAHLVEDHVLNHYISSMLPPQQALHDSMAFARAEDPELVKQVANQGGDAGAIVVAFLKKNFAELHMEWVRFKLAESQLPLAFGNPVFRRIAVQLRDVVEPAAH